jgi:pyruvate-ferredoxin/flavodoxin oxidoreductase
MRIRPEQITVDGNEAVARIAYALSDVIAIYPITPASPMGEWADTWAGLGARNLWGAVPSVVEMQSEAGAAGTVHGALQGGALATTFTASQGLLLMIPNMFKIAGELTPAVFHVAARSVATHALSIFGDHSDVMAARSTGFAMLVSGSVQEAHDFALIAQAATLAGRLPVVHFFDGFRTSHEVAKIDALATADLRAMIDERLVGAHRERGLTPERPVIRGTSQNPDVFFQNREAVNPFHRDFPGVLQETFDRFAAAVGPRYGLFDYCGAADAERVIVLMGSGAETAQATVERLQAAGERVGVVKVRLFRPFASAAFVASLPPTVRAVAVLDRTKEPGAAGEPLYLDVVAALHESGRSLRVVGGRYGLASKEFTPAMVRAVLEELRAPAPRNHFTVGIVDDVTGNSLAVDETFDIDDDAGATRAVFFGLGSDGTVGANKNSIKIIGEETPLHAQGYFVYDSKKAGAVTVSHLRFGPRPLRASYLIRPGTAGFVACHHPRLLERHDVLALAAPGATLLLNAPGPAAAVWQRLPAAVRAAIVARGVRVFAIDAAALAGSLGLGGRINTIMQACFFHLAGVLPAERARAAIEAAITETWGKRGREIVERNLRAAAQAVEHLHAIDVPAEAIGRDGAAAVPDTAPAFVREVTAALLRGEGDRLPVSALPADGTFPTGTARYEKRAIASEIPIWESDLCIQCGKCAIVCPHAAIRAKVFSPESLAAAPAGFRSEPFRGREHAGLLATIQVAPEDCTGCTICVQVCPAKDRTEPRRKAINMRPIGDHLERERTNFEFFLGLPELDRTTVRADLVRESQLFEPLFEFSGACAGCGETPYLKLLSQLFGDRAVIANATGCSSIYGGNLPTTPWSKNRDGRGPAWSNSLFEDAAEFGLGFRLAYDQQRAEAVALVRALRAPIGNELADALLGDPPRDEAGMGERRAKVALLRDRLRALGQPSARRLAGLADTLVHRSVWIVGGDGWAYDIGFGGLDHVLASGRDVNVLLLDTEVYSNTGGQMSKATPRAAIAKFAAEGKGTAKKDLGSMAMDHTHVYVARVAMGANDKQTLQAFLEAESYRGPSLIIAYSHCIAHGLDMAAGMLHQHDAVACGHWPLYRYDPRRLLEGKNPLQLDSRAPSKKFVDFAASESRFHMLTRAHPDIARRLQALAQRDIDERWSLLQQRAAMHYDPEVEP